MADRETRNLADAETIEKLVIGGEIQVHYVKDRKVLNKDSSSGDFFMRDIGAAMAKQFSVVTGQKISAACLHKAEQGWYPGNKPLWVTKTLSHQVRIRLQDVLCR